MTALVQDHNENQPTMSQSLYCDSAPFAVELCNMCGVKKRCSVSNTCSRRCSWFAEGGCPQCGRKRQGAAPFCSYSCASTSLQANWCPGCAVRQAIIGRSHCSDICSLIAPGADAMKRRSKKDNLIQEALIWVPVENRTALRSLHMRESIPAASRVLQTVPPSVRVRQYLNYRSAVEQRLTQLGLPKVGHGGEGNELRRYVPLRMTCDFGAQRNPTCCTDTNCEVCSVIRDGFSLTNSWKASHYATSTVSAAMKWATPNPQGVRAVAIVRAVIGFPQVLQDSKDIDTPWEDGYDSVLVTNGKPEQDGTYLFCDNALDLQYVLFA